MRKQKQQVKEVMNLDNIEDFDVKIPDRLIVEKALKVNHIRLWFVIEHLKHKEGIVSPTISQLSEILGVNKRKIRVLLMKLINLGVYRLGEIQEA